MLRWSGCNQSTLKERKYGRLSSEAPWSVISGEKKAELLFEENVTNEIAAAFMS